MADTAAWLVDRVLRRDIRWRQWVVTFPPPLATGLCFRGELASAIVRIVMRVLFAWQRARAADGPIGTHPAAVVWIQRFSDGAGPWFHLHILQPDGTFREAGTSLEMQFEPQPAPSESDLQRLVRRLAARITRYVERHRDVAPDDPLLVRCSRQPATHLRDPTPPKGARARTRRPRLLAEHEGFSIHAATTAGPHDPAALERLCRYLARPPIPQGRLERLLDGRIAFRLKRRRRGVGQLVFTPDAFLARLAALIPRPMSNQTLYFGALATASSARPYVVPPPPSSTPQRPTAPERPARMAHADLLRRVFAIDLHQCPCGGRLHLVAVINNSDVHQAVAAAIIVSDQRPSRAPPPPPHH